MLCITLAGPVGAKYIDLDATPVRVRERANQVRIDTTDLTSRLDCAGRPSDDSSISLTQNMRLSFYRRDGNVSGTVLGLARADYLDRACGDNAAPRAEVLRLLTASNGAEDYCDTNRRPEQLRTSETEACRPLVPPGVTPKRCSLWDQNQRPQSEVLSLAEEVLTACEDRREQSCP